MRHPDVKRWVLFQCSTKKDGSVAKLPITPTGKPASCTNPATWSNFDACIAAFDRWHVGTALGFALGKDFKLLCLDFDGCINPDGSVTDTAFKYIDSLMPGLPYIERSISGRGLHIFAWYHGEFNHDTHPEPGVELFTHDRFIVCTGVPL